MSSVVCGCDFDANHYCSNYPDCVGGKILAEEERVLGEVINDLCGCDICQGIKVRPPSEETLITDAITGGQKGSKLAQLGAIEPKALMELAKVAGYGATKYAYYNYLKGYTWSLSYDALQRHLHAFWGGEDKDSESGLYHLAHAAWHCLALLSYTLLGLGTDNRWKSGRGVEVVPGIYKAAESRSVFAPDKQQHR